MLIINMVSEVWNSLQESFNCLCLQTVPLAVTLKVRFRIKNVCVSKTPQTIVAPCYKSIVVKSTFSKLQKMIVAPCFKLIVNKQSHLLFNIHQDYIPDRFQSTTLRAVIVTKTTKTIVAPRCKQLSLKT